MRDIIFLQGIVMGRGKELFANIILILTLIASAILIFVIKPWIVLIINVCVNVLYRILCFEMKTSKKKVLLQYLFMCIVSIGLMIFIMLNLDKISYLLQHKDDMKYIHNILGKDYLMKDPGKYGWTTNGVNTDKLTKYCYTVAGIMMTILIIHHIICGLVLIFNYEGTEDTTGAFCLAFPLLSIGVLAIFFSTFNFSIASMPFSQTTRWILSIGYVALIELLLFVVIAHFYDGGGGSRSGGSGDDTYHVIIFKD